MSCSTIDSDWIAATLRDRLAGVLHHAACSRVLDLIDHADGDFAAIAQAVGTDPYLTVRVISLSTLESGGERVTSLTRAVQLIGVRQVHALTIAAMLMAMVDSVDSPEHRRRLWRWITATAAATHWLEAQHQDRSGHDGSLLVEGLLGAIGSGLGLLLLMVADERRMAAAMGEPVDVVDLPRREVQAFGLTHFGVAALALDHLKAPPALRRIVDALENGDQTFDATLGRAAEILGAAAATGFGARSEAWLLDAAARLDVPADELVDAPAVIAEDARALARTMGADGGQWPRPRVDLARDAGILIENLLTDRLTLAQSMGPTASDLLATFQAEREAITDPLTGLFNRRGFEQHRSLAHMPSQQHAALVLFDLDHFKRVNDRLGHAAGDTVLLETAEALRGTIGAASVAGRVGGDEFALVLVAPKPEAVLRWHERFQVRFASATLASIGEPVTASVGAVWTTIQQLRRGFEDLQATADRALYEAKSRGRDGIVQVVPTSDD